MLVRCAVVAVGVAMFAAVTEAAALVGPHVLAPTGGPSVAGNDVAERVVQPGDTLWSIAAALHGDGDIRARVDRLARLNGGAAIRAGDTVRVPIEWVSVEP